ncbi:hypothetical protein M408DRAFT_333526 [Serendipita vermifera MAFF 305830]|uniref:DUF4110 domain-containing protein n=1 Tax=Serendipita vermifera MAFF 305830 TaxID=933852 RepID=A0A0C2W4D0_SERVB|nr:hypothetical protein M408DRAFT_333526 [Serendipita vermifera MAFF 305830]
MPKKKTSATAASGKAAAKAAKRAKAAEKVERKETKKVKAGKSKSKSGGLEDDDQDLEAILAKIQQDWERAHTVTEETSEGPPSRRANATLTPCPIGNYLWCIGGEYFSDDKKAYFYNDVYRYSPEKDEWRKFASPTCPGPRSAHAVVASPASGGKLFLFGGEFSSLYQNSFHHYRDFWVFDVQNHLWDRIETKVRPSGRSGHRMILWKHYIVLFGGFIDPGVRTNYLQDLWVFDTQEYKWQQVEFKENERRPSPRSGFSFLPVPEGAILHGGYCKEYVKGQRPQGIALEDTWLLKMDLDLKLIKWEKRKKIGYAPSLRSGCSMAFWSAKGMGVLFGGVYDDDKDEETLESVFYNDMYGYQVAGNGRWVSLALKRPKKKPAGGTSRKSKKNAQSADDSNIVMEVSKRDQDLEDEDEDDVMQSPVSPVSPVIPKKTKEPVQEADPGIDPDDPNATLPLVRYNAMLAVLRNTLYIYGGIYERGAKEYTLDDFYSLQLDKLDKVVCLKESGIVPEEGANDSSDEEDDGDDDSDSSSENEDAEMEHEEDQAEEPIIQPEEVENPVKVDTPSEIRLKAQALLQQANVVPSSATSGEPSNSDAHITPLPGETLSTFYARTKDHWASKARHEGGSDNRGKLLRRDGFTMAQERWEEYKPVLEEVEKILRESGLDDGGEVVMTGGKTAGGSLLESRNRR